MLKFTATQIETKSIDAIRIEDIHISRINDPENGPTVTLILTEGETSVGDKGEVIYLPLRERREDFGPTEVRAAMVQSPDGATLYDAIKSAAYALLAGQGKVPSGTVE